MSHTCSTLALLLLLLITLPHVYAYNDGEMNKNGIADKESFISVHDNKEVVYAFSIDTKMKMEQLGGRKMAVPRKLDIAKHNPGSTGGSPLRVISGKYDSNYDKIEVGESENHYIHQDQKKLESNMQKNSGILGSPRHDDQVHNINTKTNECQESKATTSKSSSDLLIQRPQQHDPKPKPEMHRLLLEAMVNLMHKDYNGVNKPRRKPPINNHVPIH